MKVPMTATMNKPGRKPLPEERKKVLVSTRLDPPAKAQVAQLMGLWGLDESNTVRRLVMSGLAAEMESRPSSTRIALIGHKLDSLNAESRLKAEVLLRMLEREVSEMLAAQTS